MSKSVARVPGRTPAGRPRLPETAEGNNGSSLGYAVSLNRSDAEAMQLMGYLMGLRGRPVEALSWIDRAITLNPLNRQWYNHDRALALYELGEYAAAAEVLEIAPPHRPWIDLRLAACFAKLGNQTKARRHIEAVLAFDPKMRCCDAYLGGLVYEHPVDNAHLIDGISLALEMAGQHLGNRGPRI
jgi:tetratricopeptide (TPR) repeat protein